MTTLPETGSAAVRRQLLDRTVRQVKDRNGRYDQQEILEVIDEEVAAARSDPR